jgi:hypothetical protein
MGIIRPVLSSTIFSTRLLTVKVLPQYGTSSASKKAEISIPRVESGEYVSVGFDMDNLAGLEV